MMEADKHYCLQSTAIFQFKWKCQVLVVVVCDGDELMPFFGLLKEEEEVENHFRLLKMVVIFFLIYYTDVNINNIILIDVDDAFFNAFVKKL
jgi:hypothetical protein